MVQEEQKILKKLARTKIAKYIDNNPEDKNIKELGGNALKQIDDPNCIISREHVEIASKINNEDRINKYEIMALINCSYRYFRDFVRRKIGLVKENKGNYSRTDVEIFLETYKTNNGAKNLHRN